MFPTTLITALLVATSAPPPSVPDAMLAKVSDGCEVVFYLGDTAALVANPGESGLATFLADSRVTDGIQLLFDGVEEEAQSLMPALLPVLQEMHAGAIGISISGEGGRITFRGTEELLPKVLLFLEAAVESEREEWTIDGQTYYSLIDKLNRFVIKESDDEIMITVENVDDYSVEDQAKDVTARLSQEPDEESEPWWGNLAERPAQPVFELLVDGAAFGDDEDPELQMISEVVDGVYFGLSEDGPGEMEAVMAVTYEPVELMSDLSAVFESGDTELLKIAPSDAAGIGVVRMDIQGLIEAFASFADSMEPGLYGQYEDGLDAAESVLGISIEEGIYDNMTGDYFVVQWEQDPAEIFADEGDVSAALKNIGAMGAFFEDSEPFLTLLELAEQGLGSDMVTTSSGDGYDGWSFEIMEDAELFVAVTDSCILFGPDYHVLPVLDRLGTTEADGYMTPTMLKAAEEITRGIGWSIFSSHAFLDSLSTGIEMGFGEEIGASEDVLDAALGMVDALRDVLGETTYVDTAIEEDRFAVRFVAR